MHFLFPTLSFAAAFLFFTGEFYFSEWLLPFFGGSSHVWLTSMFFYTSVLLLSYLAALFLNNLKLAYRLFFFSFCLFMSGLVFYFALEPFTGLGPVSNILITLSVRAGFPLFMLGLVTPLLQKNSGDRILLRYANLGSLLGPLSYPLFFDFVLGMGQKWSWWKYGVGLTAFGSIIILVLQKKTDLVVSTSPSLGWKNCRPGEVGKWVFLSFLSCLMMLSTTNFVTQGLGPIPLLWMFPLVIYLATYWMAFTPSLAKVNLNLKKYGPVLWACLQFLSLAWLKQNSYLTHFTYYLFLFLATLIVNSEIYRTRPASSLHLVFYYFVLNVGGTLATFFVSIAMPNISLSLGNIYLEFLLAIFLFALFLVHRDRALLVRNRKAQVVMGVVFLLILSQLVPGFQTQLASRRNFYGLVRIVEEDGEISMVHGQTVHGSRKIENQKSELPLVYYHPKSGIGEAFEFLNFPKKVLGIGLGAGSVLYYAHQEDKWDFIEINSDVALLAKEYFHYLSRSKATVRIEINDGRQALVHSNKQYDLMILDAFNSNSVPFYLLTREAFQIYLQHMTAKGILMVHISNNFCDLLKVIAPVARDLGLKLAYAERTVSDDLGRSESLWAILSMDTETVEKLIDQKGWQRPSEEIFQGPIWTDDRKNVLGILKI